MLVISKLIGFLVGTFVYVDVMLTQVDKAPPFKVESLKVADGWEEWLLVAREMMVSKLREKLQIQIKR